MEPFLLALALSLGLSALAVPLLVRLAVYDLPNERSLHSAPTPRGGGIAPAVACLTAAFVAHDLGSLALLLIAVSGGYALLGLAEDLLGAPPLVRLALQAAIPAVALLALPVEGQNPAIAVGVVIWVAAYANAYNFMDGIDGISAVQTLVAGGAWALAGMVFENGELALAGLIAAGGALGFLPFNFPRARMFLGDAGSLFFGSWLSVTAAWAVVTGVPAEAVVAPLALYLADTGSTLVKRVRRGEPWLKPHREHTYQRLVQLGASHARVDLLVLGVMVLCSVLGLLAARSPLGLRLAADVGVLLLLGWYLATPRLVSRTAATL